mmetsp:Transcript_8929/g.7968  ORF Transcript_8929/g.7968 Transcript_8929/m.7968 type:complete len:465 (+) Transcript_8929:3-1397(+)
MIKSINTVILILIYCFIIVNCYDPEQVHLALGRSPDTMAVQWATMDTYCTTATNVQYGISESDLDNFVEGECYEFNVGNIQIQQSHHVAYLIKLEASTKYYYKVGDNSTSTWSTIYHFTTAPDATTLQSSLPQKFIIYGDLGSGASQPDHSSTIMPWASLEVQTGDIDMILHVGDFAYDLDSNRGLVGRQFMNEISNMSAYVPYMVDQGNHESGYDFAHYTEFFRNQPYNLDYPTVNTLNGNAPNNWYFSWNIGLVHFITISSEIYFDHPTMISDQWNWLKSDLEIANNNRTLAPWIVVNAHRSIYCSCDSDCGSAATTLRAGVKQTDGSYAYGIEELLYNYGVDLWINGHEHNYERMYDIAPNEIYTYLSGISTQSTIDPPATIYIVTGDAGNDEDHEEFSYSQPSRTAFRTSSYGYSRMSIYNETHLYWEQVECDLSVSPTVVNEVIDSFWLIQNNHGSFSR